MLAMNVYDYFDKSCLVSDALTIVLKDYDGYYHAANNYQVARLPSAIAGSLLGKTTRGLGIDPATSQCREWILCFGNYQMANETVH